MNIPVRLVSSIYSIVFDSSNIKMCEFATNSAIQLRLPAGAQGRHYYQDIFTASDGIVAPAHRFHMNADDHYIEGLVLAVAINA